MNKLLDLFGATLQKHGMFPAVAILALVLGGYGCYTAQRNSLAIQQQAIDLARLEARLDANTEKLTDRMSGVEKNLIELTIQIRLLVDGKLNVGAASDNKGTGRNYSSLRRKVDSCILRK